MAYRGGGRAKNRASVTPTSLFKRAAFTLLAFLLLVGCGVEENSSNTTPVQFNLVHGQKQKASFAPSASGVASVTLAITGAGITPIFLKTSDTPLDELDETVVIDVA